MFRQLLISRTGEVITTLKPHHGKCGFSKLARWCRSDTPLTESGWVSPCQHDAVSRQDWRETDGADLVPHRCRLPEGLWVRRQRGGRRRNRRQVMHLSDVCEVWACSTMPQPGQSTPRLCPDTEKQPPCLMSSMAQRKKHRNRGGEDSILFREGPMVWSSHPEEECLMDLAWRDQQGQKRKAVALAVTPIADAMLEDALSFVELPAPKASPSTIIALVQPVVRVRPGRTADGEPITKEYFFRVRSSDAVWLKALQDRWPIALPKLMLGIGLGLWSLPWTRMARPPLPTGKKRSTLSIHIRDDQWGQLCANAATAIPANPDPVRYCVVATLGRVMVPKPGPLLLTAPEQLVMQSVHRAIQLGHQTNLLSQHHPDMGHLEKTRAELRGRIEQNGLCLEDTAHITRLQTLLKQLEAKANLCASAEEEWRTFHSAASKIALPKTQNLKGTK